VKRWRIHLSCIVQFAKNRAICSRNTLQTRKALAALALHRRAHFHRRQAHPDNERGGNPPMAENVSRKVNILTLRLNTRVNSSAKLLIRSAILSSYRFRGRGHGGCPGAAAAVRVQELFELTQC
jgi:hypothetical protein